jgi:hypothetical protein
VLEYLHGNHQLRWLAKVGVTTKFLQPLTNNKWPLGSDPGGHHFVVLNVSINKKPLFFSEVVTKKTGKIEDSTLPF